MSREVSLLLYPWDIAIDGHDEIVDQSAELGIHRLQVAAAYHSAEILAPRRKSNVVYTPQPNRAHIPLPADTFSGASLPPSDLAIAYPELVPDLREAAASRGMSLDGWLVVFHNSALAVEHPDLAIRNCFGDQFAHGLCPSNEEARRYAKELVAGVLSAGLFSRILVESMSYLLGPHGHAHQLWGIRLDPVSRYLLSLCFCPSCLHRARRQGIDGERIRERAIVELTRRWTAPAFDQSQSGAELRSLLISWPELAALTAVRAAAVTSLVAEIHELCIAANVSLDVSAAVWGRPAQMNWQEGVDIAQTLRTADGFVVETYQQDVAEVAGELRHVESIYEQVSQSSGTPGAELTVALTLWESQNSDLDNLLAKVRAAREAGASRLALYNWSTATVRTLSWVPEIVGEFTGARS